MTKVLKPFKVLNIYYIISQQKSEPNLANVDKKNNGVNEARESRRRTDQPTATQLNLNQATRPNHEALYVTPALPIPTSLVYARI